MTVTLNASLSTSGNLITDLRRTNSLHVSQTGVGYHSDMAIVGTSAVALGFGALTTNGGSYFRNLSPYGTISLGPLISATLHKTVDLGPNEMAVFQLEPSVAVSAIATQSCILEWWVAEL